MTKPNKLKKQKISQRSTMEGHAAPEPQLADPWPRLYSLLEVNSYSKLSMRVIICVCVLQSVW